MKFHKSRLQTIEEKKSLRQAIFFFFLTVLLILVLFFIGLPLIIKFSVFLGNQQAPNQTSDINQLNPVQPRLTSLPQATNSANLSISGSAPSGIKIQIFLNEALLKEIVTDKDGEFHLSNIVLNEGKNIIKALSVINDKESEPYFSTIIYKKNPPKLEIAQPQNNSNFYDIENEITIEGITDPQTTVNINDHLAIVDSEGNFSLKLILKEGENVFNVVAQDDAGNQSQTQLSVTYTL